MRVALIMRILLSHCERCYLAGSQAAAERLRTTLQPLSRASWDELEYVRLWAVLMGHFCCEEARDAQAWFAREADKHMGGDVVVKVAGNTTLVDDMVAVLKRFFY